MLAYGIKGYKWKQEYWDYGLAKEGAETIEAINALREKVMVPFAPLLPLSKTKSFPFCEFLALLRGHLEALHVAETLEQWVEDATDSGNLHKAEEHRQIWHLVMDVLQKAEDILGRKA